MIKALAMSFRQHDGSFDHECAGWWGGSYPCRTMSEHHDPQVAESAERNADDVRTNWVQRRRDRIYHEIQANRRGEYRVPTWVLATVLGLIVAGWLALILFT